MTAYATDAEYCAAKREIGNALVALDMMLPEEAESYLRERKKALNEEHVELVYREGSKNDQ